MSEPSWDEIFARAIDALPSDSFPEKNVTKTTEELGEWAAEVFDGNTGSTRLYEQADVILSVVMDLSFSGHSVEELKKHAIVKLERQERRIRGEKPMDKSLEELTKPCICEKRFTIESHGDGYALYLGRCDHKHGFNMMHITECVNRDYLDLIERLLNEYLEETG